MRAPILIIGAHRSGTSATADALRLLGLKIGRRLDSHSEPRALQQIHESYLHRTGGAWYNTEPLVAWLASETGIEHCSRTLAHAVRRDFAGTFGYGGPAGWLDVVRIKAGAAWGWKEPRTTLFVAPWLKIFPDARVVHVVRHPLDVALSIQRRELKFREAGDPPSGRLHDLEACVDLVARYTEIGEDAARIASHFHRVRFEDLQQDAAGQLLKLSAFCGLKPSSSQMQAAINSIQPEKAGRWRKLPAEQVRALLSRHPIAAALGYTLDD